MSENEYDDSLRPRKRSLVWHFFEKLSRDRVRCRMCGHEQNYQGTTGNILSHLKSKHELDATIKGLQLPRNQERMKLLLRNLSTYSPMPVAKIKIERNYQTKTREEKHPEDNIDNYDGDGVDEEYLNTDDMFEAEDECMVDYVGFEQPVCDDNSNDSWAPPKISNSPKSKRRIQLDKELVAAETEYYRQRAEYFKLQKFLTALQAKKLQIEMEQLNNINNDVI